jgi:NADH-quinone oxidoreductase subunit G
MPPSSWSPLGFDLLEGRQTGLPTTRPARLRSISTPYRGLETADFILLVGTNPRWEATLVNTRIRKAVRHGATVAAIGPEVDLTYR